MSAVKSCVLFALLASCYGYRELANGGVSVYSPVFPEPRKVADVRFETCRHPDASFLKGEKIVGPRAHERLSLKDLPSSWFWGNVNGTNYLTETRNQHIPQYCGSCWAFGTTSMLSDRLRIKTGNRFPDVVLAPQVLINCGGGGTCHGGNPLAVYEYIYQYGLPDETCQNYEAVDGQCAPYGICETCSPAKPGDASKAGSCASIKKYTRYGLTQYGLVESGAGTDRDGLKMSIHDKLKAELFLNGPVACGIHVTDGFVKYAGGIYAEDVWFPMPNHELSLVGYGVEHGQEYWIGRNSWGTYWGESGYFRIAMYDSNLGITDTCSWADPIVQVDITPPGQLVETGAGGLFTMDASVKPGTYFDYQRPGIVKSVAPVELVVKSPLPHTYIQTQDIPDSYDIRDLKGINYASVDRNQHIPQYCGSCWAHATSSALNDRFALIRKDVFPDIVLSPQVLVNCVAANESHGCFGGDPTAAYSYILQSGIPDETCSNYQALNKECNALNTCKSCDWGGCWPIDTTVFTTYQIEEHGQVSGEANMLAEIIARGPIACEICVTPEFEAYTGGIFKDGSSCERRDHSIEVAGFGEEDGVQYWLGRNSWGTYWGEKGWFKIVRGEGSLGIENHCDWAVPKRPADVHIS